MKKFAIGAAVLTVIGAVTVLIWGAQKKAV